MVKRSEAVGQGLPRCVVKHQAGSCGDLPNACDRGLAAECGGLHGCLFAGRRGEDEFVVVAARQHAGQSPFGRARPAAGGRLGAGHEAGHAARVDARTHATGPQDVAQVAEQAVADVGHGGCGAAQRLAQGHAGSGAFHAQAGGIEHGLRQADAATKSFKRHPCIAQVSADIEVVPSLCAPAQDGLARRHFAHDGDGDVERTLGGVAADQLALVRIGQGQQSLRKTCQPVRVGTRQGQREQKGARRGPAGGQVAQVDGQRFVPQARRVDGGQKVPAFHQHVGGQGQLMSSAGRPDGAVIANAHRGLVWRSLEKAVNQFKFTHDCKLNRMDAWRRRSAGGSVQGAAGDARAQCAVGGFEHKGADGHIKAVPVFGHKEEAAAHGATGRAQAATTGVLEGLARLQQGLLANNTQALDFFGVSQVVLNEPVPRDQLCGHPAGVAHGDGVSESEEGV